MHPRLKDAARRAITLMCGAVLGIATIDRSNSRMGGPHVHVSFNATACLGHSAVGMFPRRCRRRQGSPPHNGGSSLHTRPCSEKSRTAGGGSATSCMHIHSAQSVSKCFYAPAVRTLTPGPRHLTRQLLHGPRANDALQLLQSGKDALRILRGTYAEQHGGGRWHGRDAVGHDAIHVDHIPIVNHTREVKSPPAASTVFVMLMSSANKLSRQKRAVMRQTWLGASHRLTCKFFFGTRGMSAAVLKGLQEEQQQHGDLVFLVGFHDDYTKLAHKLLECFAWIVRHAPNHAYSVSQIKHARTEPCVQCIEPCVQCIANQIKHIITARGLGFSK